MTNRFKVLQALRIYEINGEDVPVGKKKELRVSSHWNHGDLVVLDIDGTSVAVPATDLSKAITNATNC